MRYVDASGMRVMTNSTHVAEQINNDRDECIVMDDLKIAEPRKIGGKQHLKSHRDGWSKIWKNWEI